MQSYPIPKKKELKGKTTTEISAKYRVSWITAKNWQAYHKLKTPGRWRNVKSPPSAKKLIGKTIDEICAEFNCSHHIARRWALQLGVRDQLASSSWQWRITSLRKTIDRLKQWGRYAPAFACMTDSQLGRAFELSRERIRQLRVEFGWPCTYAHTKTMIDTGVK